MNRVFLCLPVILGLCGRALAADEDITIAHDRQARTITVTIRAHAGRVPWSAVCRGLARAKGLDDSALDGILPAKSVSLRKRGTGVVFWLVNRSLKGCIRLSIIPASDRREEPALRITLDRNATLASKRRIKELLRRLASVLRSPQSKAFGLKLDRGWQRAPRRTNLAVLIPGLHSNPERYTSFLALVRRRGFPVGVLCYPNDQAIKDSAHLLAEELRKVRRRQRSRGVALVALSMGGLVARAAVEDPKLDPGNVRRVIMVGTPNHGSGLSRFGFVPELLEHMLQEKNGGLLARVADAVEDGLGEAYTDMSPDSDFLRRLNARPRNPNVRYSLFLGSGGRLDEDDVARLRARLEKAGDKNRAAKLFRPYLGKLADLEEVKRGKGDGAVSVARGRLLGVKDTVVLPFSHMTMVVGNQTDAEKRLRREIVERLTLPQVSNGPRMRNMLSSQALESENVDGEQP